MISKTNVSQFAESSDCIIRKKHQFKKRAGASPRPNEIKKHLILKCVDQRLKLAKIFKTSQIKR